MVIKHPVSLAPKIAGVPADSVRYAYDPLTGFLATVTDLLGNVFTLSYNNRSERVGLLMPGAINQRFGYDPSGRLVADTVLNTSTSPYKHLDAVLRRMRLHYRDPERVDSMLSTVGWNDTLAATYDGLGQLVQKTSSARGGPNFQLPLRLASTESVATDALGNAYSSSHSTNVATSYREQYNYGTRGQRYGPLTGGQPTGRLRAASDALATDTLWYDQAGNMRFRFQTVAAQNAYLHDQVFWYGADGRLRTAEYRNARKDVQEGPYEIIFEQYRYDALGRRVLVRTARDCKQAEIPIVAWCSLGTIRRTVWDGNAELYEIQMLGSLAFQTGGIDLENDTLPWPSSYVTTNYPGFWHGNKVFGRVAYTYGTDLDRPLSITRIGLQDTVWNGPTRHWPAFAVLPHWNWRGEADYGTLADSSGVDGGIKICWPSDPSRCVQPLWKPSLFAVARQAGDTMGPQWFGTLLEGKQDGVGVQYRRHRYVDPTSGRFTQEDPIGLAGGLNLYGFANGDPVNFSDPFGLNPCPGPSTSFPCRIQAAVARWKASIASVGASVLAFVGEASGVAPAMRSGGFPNPDGSSPSGGQRLVDGLLAASALVPGDEALSVGRTIARGHAWGRHADQFASIGIRTTDDFARHIESVIQGGEVRTLSRGRTAYWDEATGTVVIHNPRATDLGTAFRPTQGRTYFTDILK